MASYYLEISEFLYDTGLTKLGMFDVLRLFLEFDFLNFILKTRIIRLDVST